MSETPTPGSSPNPSQLLARQVQLLESIETSLRQTQEQQALLLQRLDALPSQSPQQTGGIAEVKVKDVQISFGSLFGILIKWSLSGLLLAAVAMAIAALFMMLFGGLGALLMALGSLR